MKRRWLPFLMLVVLGYQCLGYPLAFVGALLGHRMAMAAEVEEMENEAMITIQLTDQEYQGLTWRGRRDFLYQGKMHDLKLAQRRPDGKWTLVCKVDERETEMLANGAKAFEEEEEDDESHSTPPLHEGPIYTQPGTLAASAIKTERIAWPLVAHPCKSLAMDILSPPPRMG